MRRKNGIDAADLAEKQLCEELAVFALPEGRKPLIAELHHAVRLLLLARSRQERTIIGLHVYHGQPLEGLATALGLPLGHVRDVIESLCVREQQVVLALGNRKRLERLERRQPK